MLVGITASSVAVLPSPQGYTFVGNRFLVPTTVLTAAKKQHLARFTWYVEALNLFHGQYVTIGVTQYLGLRYSMGPFWIVIFHALRV